MLQEARGGSPKLASGCREMACNLSLEVFLGKLDISAWDDGMLKALRLGLALIITRRTGHFVQQDAVHVGRD